MERVAALLAEIIRETEQFDSQYDRRIRDLAVEALAVVTMIAAQSPPPPATTEPS